MNNQQALAPTSVGMTDLQSFELAQRIAKLLASSNLVPIQYQGNVANCVIALNMANRMGADPLMVMQNLYIVHGKPSWSSQFLISVFNTSGRFSAIRYEFFGEKGTDTWGCRAYAIELATQEKLVGADITIGLAKKEGWYGRSNSKWQSTPQQMLMYRSASWFVRAYAPELAMGLHTKDEIEDSEIIDVTPPVFEVKPSTKLDDVIAQATQEQTQVNKTVEMVEAVAPVEPPKQAKPRQKAVTPITPTTENSLFGNME